MLPCSSLERYPVGVCNDQICFFVDESLGSEVFRVFPVNSVVKNVTKVRVNVGKWGNNVSVDFKIFVRLMGSAEPEKLTLKSTFVVSLNLFYYILLTFFQPIFI